MPYRWTANGKERSRLRGRVHDDRPLVQIGKGGLDEGLIASAEQVLHSREVIKVRVLNNCPLEPRVATDRLAEAIEAEILGRVGSVAILYKPRPEEASPES